MAKRRSQREAHLAGGVVSNMREALLHSRLFSKTVFFVFFLNCNKKKQWRMDFSHFLGVCWLLDDIVRMLLVKNTDKSKFSTIWESLKTRSEAQGTIQCQLEGTTDREVMQMCPLFLFKYVCDCFEPCLCYIIFIMHSKSQMCGWFHQKYSIFIMAKNDASLTPIIQVNIAVSKSIFKGLVE